MLEYFANQASGLIGLGAQPGPRLIAVVSHGDEQAELPLMWQLCMALVTFGYTLTVLDATTIESDTNPGLLNMLEDSGWNSDEMRQTGAWTVLPAGAGIQRLASEQSTGHQALQELGHLFPLGSVVILYAKVEWMIPLVGESLIEPLLAVSPARNSLLTSYSALKRLLITGKVKPTIVNMISEQPSTARLQPQSVSASLSECARRFLGQDVKTLNIAEQYGEEGIPLESQQLALRLLEGALPLNPDHWPGVPTGTPATHFGQVDHFAGSH